MSNLSIPVGTTGTAQRLVDQTNLASSLGSGTVDVYATPAMIALMEQAAVHALADFLPAESTSVGIHLDVEHLAATPRGMQVTASATVTAVDGRIITFDLSASDELEEIGRGTHRRALVNAEKFQMRTDSKIDQR